MTIDTLTPFSVAAPTRTDPDTFASRGDTIMTELVDLIPDVNTMIGQMNTATAQVTTDKNTASAAATNASASETAAAASAATAVNAPGTSATSTTSAAIPTTWPTSVSLTIQTGKSWAVGQPVQITATSSPNNFIFGYITSYNSGTGALVVNAVASQGSGTFTAWSVALCGPALTTTANTIQSKSSAYTALTTDKGSIFKVTGTWTLSFSAAATLGAGWDCYVENVGTGVVTFDPNGSELINGVTTYGTAAKGQMYLIYCDGSAFTAKRVAGPKPRIKVSDQKSSGTGAGSPVATDITQTRTLNTTEVNTMFGASLSSNQVTLPAGILNVFGRAPANLGGASGAHQCFLYNTTDSNYAMIGSGCNSFSITGDSILCGQLTTTASKVFTVRHYTASSTGALGSPGGTGSQVEKYTELLIELED